MCCNERRNQLKEALGKIPPDTKDNRSLRHDILLTIQYLESTCNGGSEIWGHSSKIEATRARQETLDLATQVENRINECGF